MIDSDNVLLFEPDAAHGFDGLSPRPAPESIGDAGAGLVVASLYYVKPGDIVRFGHEFRRLALKVIEDSGAHVLAQYETSTQPNNFPSLTIRTGEHIFVWFARFSGADNYQTCRARLANSADWERRIWPTLRKRLTREPEVLRLSPTNRSRFQGEFAVRADLPDSR
jgi:hypothetical protein